MFVGHPPAELLAGIRHAENPSCVVKCRDPEPRLPYSQGRVKAGRRIRGAPWAPPQIDNLPRNAPDDSGVAISDFGL